MMDEKSERVIRKTLTEEIKEGFFRIPYQTVTRDDVRSKMETDKIRISDAALSDEFMQAVANKMGDSLANEGWWDDLELAVEAVCADLDIYFDDVMCSHCGSYDTDFRSGRTFESQSITKQIDHYYCHTCDKHFEIEG